MVKGRCKHGKVKYGIRKGKCKHRKGHGPKRTVSGCGKKTCKKGFQKGKCKCRKTWRKNGARR